MGLEEKVMSEMKAAMKAKDTTTLTVLRALKSAISYATIKKHGADGELSEADAVAVVGAAQMRADATRVITQT